MAPYNFLLFIFFASTVLLRINAKLSGNYYSQTCPKAQAIVQAGVAAAIKQEGRMGASLLRLHFHDCFVNVSMYAYTFI